MIEYTVESMSKEYQQALDILDGRSTLSISPKKKTNFPILGQDSNVKGHCHCETQYKCEHHCIDSPSPKRNLLKRPSPEKTERFRG